jgi:Ax21 family sulfation-dependent quorum factor
MRARARTAKADDYASGRAVEISTHANGVMGAHIRSLRGAMIRLHAATAGGAIASQLCPATNTCGTSQRLLNEAVRARPSGTCFHHRVRKRTDTLFRFSIDSKRVLILPSSPSPRWHESNQDYMKRTALALALLPLLPIAAQANELSYSFIEGGYTRTDLDVFRDSDGLRIGGSAALGSNFHVFGNYGREEVPVQGVDLDFDLWNVGFGYHYAMSPRAHLVTELAYRKLDLGQGFDADGVSVEVGVRGLLGDRVEGWAMLGYFDGKDISGDTYARLGGQLRFNRNWGLMLEATVSDGNNNYFIGPRFTF